MVTINYHPQEKMTGMFVRPATASVNAVSSPTP
jgi:hypothetical protein